MTTDSEGDDARPDDKERAGGSAPRRALMLGGAAALAGAAASGCAAVSQPAPPVSAAAAATPPGSPAPRGRLEGQVALVTGAARGIGRAVSVACAREGAHVVGLDIAGPVSPSSVPYPHATRADLDQTAALVAKEGRRFLPVVADVRDMGAMRRAADGAVRELGRLDILVANAGIYVPFDFEAMTDQQWQDAIDVDLTGVANSMRAAMPHMIAAKSGKIVTIASTQGRAGTPTATSYTAAKWGVIGLTKSVALELGQHGIRANAVAPTAVNTPMFRNPAVQKAFLPDAAPRPPERLFAAASRQAHPLGVPWVEPEDIAAVVVFLASEEARYVSGAVYDVTAGVSGLNSA